MRIGVANRIKMIGDRLGAARISSLPGTVGVIFLLAVLVLQVGCRTAQERLIRASSFATEGIVQVESVPQNKKVPFYQRIANAAPRPSERTELLLRKYDLERQYDANPDAVIEWFQQLAKDRPTLGEIHGLAEIAEIQASWSVSKGDAERASRLYATAVIHAHQFLFDSKLNLARNAYDPQFRSICDVYNRSLEGLIRQIIANERLMSGNTFTIGQANQGIELEVQIDGRWRDQVFERFELVSDYQAEGIDHYHTYGLGVPMIAVRKQQKLQTEFEQYYPAEITLPMTAFLHLGFEDSQEPDLNSQGIRRAVLKLYDPLEKTLVKAGSKVIPLESDITMALAYGLRDPMVNKGVLATGNLLNAEYAPETYGLFMLEPYDPDKIPVVMVHGFWSSPATWVHMFNDLRANRDIHENCQFWFYSYPTGQPFWMSAQQMRADLAKIRREVDPRGDSKPLDQMVLVGHSMGGLISMMQVMESHDQFWEIVSDQPIESLDGDEATIDKLRDTFYFRPNQSIDRVITLATPFNGSEFSNPATQWVSQKLFTLPSLVTTDFEALAKRNPDKLKAGSILTTTTSIDSLAPTHPVFEAFAGASISNSVKTHNVIGRLKRKSFLKSADSSPQSGDGVVSLASAKRDDVVSQAVVEAEHSKIHQHPGSIFEVRRILLEHLVEYGRVRVRDIPQMPTAEDQFGASSVADVPEFQPLRRR